MKLSLYMFHLDLCPLFAANIIFLYDFQMNDGNHKSPPHPTPFFAYSYGNINVRFYRPCFYTGQAPGSADRLTELN